ncbi:MAG TPA: hypothetical protein VMR75_02600 [Candidatus Saccharimonadales bacterium]|nr:hypothetical protein [Candidatus Saccharimonadales bacterium]
MKQQADTPKNEKPERDQKLNKAEKDRVQQYVERVVKDYGETLKLLGNE